MVDRPKKPLSLNPVSPGLLPQAQVSITHSHSRVSATLPTGESLEVLLYGATVTSWKDASGAEKLFLSSAAVLDGSKAVRGGIPLVFPVFGTAPDHKATSALPQHGFARTSRWEFLGKSTSEGASSGTGGGDGSVKLDFGLSRSNLTEEARGKWEGEFGLIYSVTLGREGLTTSMVVRNEGEVAWEFQVLLHSYLRVKDISAVEVAGLESSSYVDKVAAETTTCSSAPVTVKSRIDRVYTPAGGPSTQVVVSEAGKKKFTIVRDNMNEVVVWNPWADGVKSIGDFEPKEGYKEMICVEAGAVKGWQKLEAGETWEGGQVILAH